MEEKIAALRAELEADLAAVHNLSLIHISEPTRRV